jgi:hypothetical protein
MDDPATPGRVHVAVRLDAEQAAEVDALIPTLSTRWHRATRSDVLRFVVIEGLAAIKKELARSPRGRAGKPATSTAVDPTPGTPEPAAKRRPRR